MLVSKLLVWEKSATCRLPRISAASETLRRCFLAELELPQKLIILRSFKMQVAGNFGGAPNIFWDRTAQWCVSHRLKALTWRDVQNAYQCAVGVAGLSKMLMKSLFQSSCCMTKKQHPSSRIIYPGTIRSSTKPSWILFRSTTLFCTRTLLTDPEQLFVSVSWEPKNDSTKALIWDVYSMLLKTGGFKDFIRKCHAKDFIRTQKWLSGSSLFIVSKKWLWLSDPRYFGMQMDARNVEAQLDRAPVLSPAVWGPTLNRCADIFNFPKKKLLFKKLKVEVRCLFQKSVGDSRNWSKAQKVLVAKHIAVEFWALIPIDFECFSNCFKWF